MLSGGVCIHVGCADDGGVALRRRSGFTLLELIAALAMLTFVASVLFSGMLSANQYSARLKLSALSLHAIDNTLERMESRGKVTVHWVQAVLSHELSASGLDDRVQGNVSVLDGGIVLEVVSSEKKTLARVEVGL